MARGDPGDIGQVEVPDLVGMIVSEARRKGHEAGLVVISADADGPLCRARTRTFALSWCFCALRRSSVLVDQAVDDLPARDPAGHVDRLAGFMERRSLFARLVGAMLVVMPRVLGQDPPEVPFAVDQQVIEALAA